MRRESGIVALILAGFGLPPPLPVTRCVSGVRQIDLIVRVGYEGWDTGRSYGTAKPGDPASRRTQLQGRQPLPS